MAFNDYMSGFSHCCKDCTKRYVGCHSKCEDYIKAKRDHEKLKEYMKQNETVEITEHDFNKVSLIWGNNRK